MHVVVGSELCSEFKGMLYTVYIIVEEKAIYFYNMLTLTMQIISNDNSFDIFRNYCLCVFYK